MNQVINEEIRVLERQKRTVGKAHVIAASRHVRRSIANPRIWCVESYSHPGQFHAVMYDSDLGDFICDCAAYRYGMTVPCLHILSCAISLEVQKREF